MSMSVISWAFDLVGVSPVAKLAAMALANNFSHPTPFSHLVEFCCVGEEEIWPALGELRQTNLVTIEVDAHGDVRASFNIPAHQVVVIGGRVPPRVNKLPCSIYVIAAQSRTKIGISHDAPSRMETLQSWVPETLRLVWTWSAERSLIREIEVACHGALSQHRIVGEWFDISPDKAIEEVRRQIERRGFKV